MHFLPDNFLSHSLGGDEAHQCRTEQHNEYHRRNPHGHPLGKGHENKAQNHLYCQINEADAQNGETVKLTSCITVHGSGNCNKLYKNRQYGEAEANPVADVLYKGHCQCNNTERGQHRRQDYVESDFVFHRFILTYALDTLMSDQPFTSH